MRLLRTPAIVVSVASLTIAAIVLAGSGFWVTQYLQSVVGLDPVSAAIAFMPMGLGIGAGTFAAPVLAKWVDPARMIPGGLAFGALGSLLQLAVSTENTLTPLLAAIALTAFGCGPLFAFGTHRIVSSAPPSAAARAAALAETSNHVGSAVGLAMLGTVASTLYATVVRRALAGFASGVPTEIMAMTRAAALQSPHREVMIEAIASAGTDSLHAVGVCAAALLTGCAILNMATFRGSPDRGRSAIA